MSESCPKEVSVDGSEKRRNKVGELTYEVAKEEAVIESQTGIIESKDFVPLSGEIDDGLSDGRT